jgi:hypothetical protein
VKGNGLPYPSRPTLTALTRRIKIVLLRNPASHAQGLEGSQTPPLRLKLRAATSGKPLYKVAAVSVAGGEPLRSMAALSVS